MAEIILITGGSRSGKSACAQKMAEARPGPRAYVATCPVIDPEMAERVRKHREARVGKGWETIEETVDLAGVIGRARGYRLLLVDCLTLWINNLLYEAEQRGERFMEQEAAERCRELIDAARACPGTVIFVTNEVGMGIVPGNETARRFRDAAGRCNQEMAAAAEKVTLVVSGIPLEIKGPNETLPLTSSRKGRGNSSHRFKELK
ncbi:MAG: bifunctional adenosylcobinamide kinase/adenosylcobinamide-phosphate guanylyltransferase [Deltaproteobacteria bacterium]|nr:bifunctional adenosylcobinamide kinase/adenosylcobinamide-phosphate guanylyltransferase [Deltaproteobacteria bacterium]